MKSLWALHWCQALSFRTLFFEVCLIGSIHTTSATSTQMLRSRSSTFGQLYSTPARRPLLPFAQAFSTRPLLLEASSPRPSEKNPTVGGVTGPQKDRLSVFPFLFIFTLGTGLYVLIVRSREGTAKKLHHHQTEFGELPFKRNRDRSKDTKDD